MQIVDKLINTKLNFDKIFKLRNVGKNMWRKIFALGEERPVKRTLFNVQETTVGRTQPQVIVASIMIDQTVF